MQLRNYQIEQTQGVISAWGAGYRNVLAVAPTGSGKTAMMTHLMSQTASGAVGIAHRTELVSQISQALARWNVRHRLIAPSATIKFIIEEHHREFGKSFYHPGALHGVASVDTLNSRGKSKIGDWAKQVGLWVQDEAHHCAPRSNKWCKATGMFPNAYGLGVTATPVRADGLGLGRHHDGIFDAIIEGPSMVELVDLGYLTPYRVFRPPSDIDESKLRVGSTGDFTVPSMKELVEGSCLVGDIVSHYKRLAMGKLGVTFVTDVETGHKVAAQYRAAGVPALCISAKTPERQRAQAIRRFRKRELLQLVNVDLFGEGFDLPAVEVVSMARPTQSFGLYRQQFGRALRPAHGKDVALVIDHVGNILRHGPPDAPRVWTLDRRDKKTRSKENDSISVTACPKCFEVYEAFRVKCPYCGHKPIPVGRAGPEFFKGDLYEMSPEDLKKLRDQAAKSDRSPASVEADIRAAGHPHMVARGQANKHAEKQKAVEQIRMTIAYWAGDLRERGLTDSESYRLFYERFDMDVLSAQTLPPKETLELEKRIRNDIGRVGQEVANIARSFSRS